MVGIRGQYLLKRRIFNLVSIFSILTVIMWLFFFSLVHNMDQEARESEDIIVIEREEIL